MVGVIRHGSKVGLSQRVSGFYSDSEQLRIEVAQARRDDAVAALFEVGSLAGLCPGSDCVFAPSPYSWGGIYLVIASQDRQERLLWDFDAADHPHALLAFLLLL